MAPQSLTLSADTWSLVFNHSTKQDLCSLCLVSHSFNTIAAPILYRCIHLIEPARDRGVFWERSDKENNDEDAKARRRGHWLLLSRLEDKGNENLRNYVQEVNLSASSSSIGPDRDFIEHLKKDNRLYDLLNSLSNLRRVCLGTAQLTTDELIQTISNHSRKPELSLSLHHIDHETGISFSSKPLPCLTNLETSINPYYERNAPNESMLQIQNLFFNSPNLHSFSMSLYGNYGGCVVRIPQFENVTSFRFTGNEKFPPLEELKLDGYPIGDTEWLHWQQGLDWSKLSSLTIGPQSAFGILKHLAGYATSLKTLRVFRYPDEGWQNQSTDRDALGLEKLLRSFDGLETLEVKGVPVAVDVVGGHRRLKRLCLHEDESAYKNVERKLLSAEEMGFLDKRCPDLRDLKVKVKIGDNEMNKDLLQKLATSFQNLCSLSLHFEIGLATLSKTTKAPLRTTSALEIGKSFFDIRRNSGIEVTPWFTLTLWTGNYFRRWPQWQPGYAGAEKKLSATFEFSVPDGQSDGVQMRHLEKEELNSYESGKRHSRAMAMFRVQDLSSRVKAVSEDPSGGKGWDSDGDL